MVIICTALKPGMEDVTVGKSYKLRWGSGVQNFTIYNDRRNSHAFHGDFSDCFVLADYDNEVGKELLKQIEL